MSLLVVPIAQLLPAATETRRLRVRAAIGWGLRSFAHLMRALGVLSYEIAGTERLGRPGQLIVANHPTLIDGIFLLGHTPTSCCIVKHALRASPFTGWAVRAAGYVSNAPTDAMVTEAAAALLAGQSVIIFPEGTRTEPGQPMRFHRGAAAIAMRAAAVVTPVFIRCIPPTLSKGSPWYRIPERRVHLSIRVGTDIDPEPLRDGAPAPIAARELNDLLLRSYATEFTAARECD